MSYRRVNLFRQIQEKQGKKISRARIVMIGLAIAIFFAGIGMGISHHNKKVKAIQEKIAEAQKELEQIAKIKEELKKPSKEQKEFQEISLLDETWTSLMWKLSTFTGPKIIFKKIRFVRPAQSTQPGEKVVEKRQIFIEGDARSLPALKDWLSNLIVNIPNYSFFMDQQSSSFNAQFPIQFKVTANLNTSGV